MGFLDDLKRYRMPILLGAGGLVAYSAFQRTRAAQAAATEAGVPAASLPTGLSTEQAVALQQAAFGQGGGLGLQGAALGLQTAERGLDLAGIATGIAGLVAGDVTGLAGTLGEQLANVTGEAIGILPDVIAPPVILPPPINNPPGATPPPPTGTGGITARAFIGYGASVPAGSASRVFTVNSAGRITGARDVSRAASAQRWSVTRRVSGGTLHWRRGDGWSFVPGRSPAFIIRKQYRVTYSTGQTAMEYVTIPDTGS
jgi:hypothetical protein